MGLVGQGLTATRNASTSGIKFVLQRPDGAVLSAATGYFTFDISGALGVGEDAPGVLGAKPVAVGEAREVILGKIAQAMAEVDAALAGG